jgi:hypothetical protein
MKVRFFIEVMFSSEAAFWLPMLIVVCGAR